MKKFTLKIVLVCMAAVISITGMGTTLANFCCNDCLDKFLTEYHIKDKTSHQNKTSCCDEKKHQEIPACNEHNKDAETECCKIERHSTVLDSFHSKPIVFSPYTWVSNSFILPSNHLSFLNKDESIKYEIEAPPNIREPRSYLSFIGVLVI